MKVEDIFNLANDYSRKGQLDMAMNLWTECISKNKYFGYAYINMANVYGKQGNAQAQKECLEKFLNCPVTGNTIDMIPKVRQELKECDKKLNPESQEKKE